MPRRVLGCGWEGTRAGVGVSELRDVPLSACRKQRRAGIEDSETGVGLGTQSCMSLSQTTKLGERQEVVKNRTFVTCGAGAMQLPRLPEGYQPQAGVEAG